MAGNPRGAGLRPSHYRQSPANSSAGAVRRRWTGMRARVRSRGRAIA